jgi:thymidylate synthase
MRQIEQIVNNSITVNEFSRMYPYVNKWVMENGDSIDSRYGHTRDILNFKTEICNPYARLVGNNDRDINVFFLLAEAIWIFKGERDVEFLEIFNSRMSEFSDDGKVFHAPYGFRLRHYGVESHFLMNTTSPENNGHHAQQMIEGEDQILTVLKMLKENPNDRRAVMSIWNTELDLGIKSKDIPCNDLVMLKVRNGKLHTTIANRSNDLHWGLTTNIFQFSFLTEIMSNILGIELGTQTHNSQSLHIYTDNEIADKLYNNLVLNSDGQFDDLYDKSNPLKMDMRFNSEGVEANLAEVDYHFGNIIIALKKGERMPSSEYADLGSFSKYLALVYDLLHIYVVYKKTPLKDDELRWAKLNDVGSLCTYYPNLDILTMAANFFAKRISDENLKNLHLIEPLGKL